MKPLWVLYLAVSCVLAVVWASLPDGPRGVVFLVIGAGATAVLVTGLRLHGVVDRRPWLLMAGGQAAFVAGDAVWLHAELVAGAVVFPSPADGLYLVGYLLLGAGLLSLARRRGAPGDSASLVDACIITAGVGVLSWVFLVVPAATDSTLTPWAKAVSVAYPLADLLLLSLVARVFFASRSRTPALRLLGGALAALLVADAMYAVSALSGADVGTAPRLVWMVNYVLLAAAALHPSVARAAVPAEAGTGSLTRARLALLAAASLIAPALLAWQDLTRPRVDGLVIALGSAALFLLVVLRMSGLVHQVQAQSARLAAVARTDALTGAPNRRAWDEQLPQALERAVRTGAPVSVVLLDLDHFKAYNDTHGHPAGDALLRDAVAAWRPELRSGDVLARYGGEEFGLVLPGCTAEEAERLVDRLRGAVPGGQTCSAGIALWDRAEGPEALVARADVALYEAKRGGRDRSSTARVLVPA